jgi:N-acetylmuramoyl-L-alanine amidase
MPTWKGIVGRSFTPDSFSDYIATISFPAWRPQFVVLHNTAVPKLADWHSLPGTTRMNNLENFYKNVQMWSAGPHLFVADDLIWVFTPLNVSGVHSPSWNSIAWGVEMVGDYAAEQFDPAVRTNTVSALATMHAALGLNPDTLRLHKEDPRTTHICPGKNVIKAEIIREIHDRLAVGEHSPGGLDQ